MNPVCSPSAARRLDGARAWLEAQSPARPVLIVAASAHAARALTAEVLGDRASFGWYRLGLGSLATTLANPVLASTGYTAIGELATRAVTARVVHGRRGRLGRFEAVADRPGLTRALASTIRELRLCGTSPAALPHDLGEILRDFEATLSAEALADRAAVLGIATEAGPGSDLAHLPTLFLDVAIRWPAEAALVRAMAHAASDVFATVPAGDPKSRAALESALGRATMLPPPPGAAGEIQAALFTDDVASASTALTLSSAPGEGRECADIAREILERARGGARFDHMAVVLRSPARYREPLAAALERAGIPAFFAEGARLPEPSGRAFLALLACAAEGLSASRFAEYLSLGQVPEGGLVAVGDAWRNPGHDLVPRSLVDLDGPAVATLPALLADPEADVAGGTLRAPRRWEHILVDAAVIGGLDRWERRLNGERTKLTRALSFESDGARRLGLSRKIKDLDALEQFAFPVLRLLDGLPAQATWSVWLDRLAAVADRALRFPDPVLEVLSAVRPMSPVGPVDLAEVTAVLEPHLADAPQPSRDSGGAVLVGTPDAVRGRSFDVVLIPGLCERVFPQRVGEDTILLDALRRRADPHLPTNTDRAADERLALRLAVGAARHHVFASWSRMDATKDRPQVPSFYCLELFRAQDGELPGHEELKRRTGGSRLAWPAPEDPRTAIDAAEYDLAWLAGLRSSTGDPAGLARYLVEASPNLARALRRRFRASRVRWHSSDGLIRSDDSEDLVRVLSAHRLAARTYSATALQHWATCPYRFALRGILRLEPREVPEPVAELDPLQRGSFIHEVQFVLLSGLRDDSLLPLHDHLAEALARLDATVTRLEVRYRDDLAPAIDRVWRDGIAEIRREMRTWLRQLAGHRVWQPWKFELAFGLPGADGRDPDSRREVVALDGVNLRGSIDLVERNDDGSLRATDYKTGRNRFPPNGIVDGGGTLQPTLYALALEVLFPGHRVASGRLSFCTGRGNFSARAVPLDDRARESVRKVLSAIDRSIEAGFLPARPKRFGASSACEYCDYATVCGPRAATATAHKGQTADLDAVRRLH